MNKTTTADLLAALIEARDWLKHLGVFNPNGLPGTADRIEQAIANSTLSLPADTGDDLKTIDQALDALRDAFTRLHSLNWESKRYGFTNETINMNSAACRKAGKAIESIYLLSSEAPAKS